MIFEGPLLIFQVELRADHQSLTEEGFRNIKIDHQHWVSARSSNQPSATSFHKGGKDLQTLLNQRSAGFSGVLTLSAFWLILFESAFSYSTGYIIYAFHFSIKEYLLFTLKLSLHESVSSGTFITEQHKSPTDFSCFSIFYTFLINCPYDSLLLFFLLKLAGIPELHEFYRYTCPYFNSAKFDDDRIRS